MLVSIYPTTRRHIPEDSNLHFHSLKSVFYHEREVTCSLETLEYANYTTMGHIPGDRNLQSHSLFYATVLHQLLGAETRFEPWRAQLQRFSKSSADKLKNFLDGRSVHNKPSCIRRKHRKMETNSYILSKIRTYDPMFERPLK
jgi:uncharacterized protein (DUF2225 family)